MPGIDVRDAARAEAERVTATTDDVTRHGIEWEWGFADGAQWAVDQLPSEAEVTTAILGRTATQGAAAVLALIRPRYEENDEHE